MTKFFGYSFAVMAAALLYGAVIGHTHHFASAAILGAFSIYLLSRKKECHVPRL